MASLTARERAALPNRAFAYIDSEGRRRLPIHDASHVRNALARFNQVHFEDEEARDRARTRLLRAAQRHGIVPIGFMSAQLKARRKLPTGTITFLLTDLERSTELLTHLGELYGPLIRDVRKLVRAEVRSAAGHEVDARGDDLLAAFASAPYALDAALAIQRATLTADWPSGSDVRLRIGLHRGRPTLTDTGYVGLSLHAVARICFAGHGGQVLLSGAVREAVAAQPVDGVSLSALGAFRFQGLPEPIELFQARADGLLRKFPPPRAATRVG